MVVTNRLRLKRLRQSAHGLAAVLVIGCIGGLLTPTAFADDLSGLTAPTETVMVVGGSSARGWADPNHNSYLRRGFDLLAKATHVNYRYVDQSIPGSPAVNVGPSTFAGWLSTNKPDVVVISWGILDDINANTPIPEFQRAIRDQIAQSLKTQAVVLVVTPPVVPANALRWHHQFEAYVTAEQQVVDSFSSANVHWFGLNRDMASFLAKNHRFSSSYAVKGWHPNTLGHTLAGQLLANELARAIGSHPIEFHSSSHSLSQAPTLPGSGV